MSKLTELAVGQAHNIDIRWDSSVDEGTLNSVRAGVFGILVQLATPVLQHFHGDLYHDANWLRQKLDVTQADDPEHGRYVAAAFGYGVRDTGTDIGIDMGLIQRHNERVYQVIVVRHENGRWSVNVHRAQ